MSLGRYDDSQKFLGRAEATIPIGSQTFSKSRMQYPIGISPFFIEKGKGANVWDIDGNKYIDLVNSLAAITLGYRNRTVDRAVRKQLKKGTIFSLPGKLETEVAELIVQTVPSAEMVRFGKNGSDATSAAIRLARAYTGRNEIAYCGYHGWQDWYIGATSRNKGVPSAVSELIHRFEYNRIESLNNLLESRSDKIAAVILEPMTNVYPEGNFLLEVKKAAHNFGAVLIFDETITGYRFALGGAQEEFQVQPDLTTLGKGIANGFPLSAVAGKREIMMEMEEIFFSGTFGGELLSLAAAKSVIELHIDSNITGKLNLIGSRVAKNVEEIISENNLQKTLSLSGHPTWKFLNWQSTNGIDSLFIKTYFMQEMLKRGVLILSTHNISTAMEESQIKEVSKIYSEVLFLISSALNQENLISKLEVSPVQPLFKIR